MAKNSNDETKGDVVNKKPFVSASDFSVPIIDFTGVQEEALSRERVVEKIKDAAEKWGMFQVINHRVPVSVLEEIIDGIVRFREQDPEMMTNNKFISVNHRVLANRVGPRISVACFFCYPTNLNSTA